MSHPSYIRASAITEAILGMMRTPTAGLRFTPSQGKALVNAIQSRATLQEPELERGIHSAATPATEAPEDPSEEDLHKTFGQAVTDAVSDAIDREMIRLGQQLERGIHSADTPAQPIADRIIAQVQRNKRSLHQSSIRYTATKAFDLIGDIMADKKLSPAQAVSQLMAITEQTIFPAQVSTEESLQSDPSDKSDPSDWNPTPPHPRRTYHKRQHE